MLIKGVIRINPFYFRTGSAFKKLVGKPKLAPYLTGCFTMIKYLYSVKQYQGHFKQL